LTEQREQTGSFSDRGAGDLKEYQRKKAWIDSSLYLKLSLSIAGCSIYWIFERSSVVFTWGRGQEDNS
jgi:hypothetical protein